MYYIIQKNNELKIIVVQPGHQEDFHKDYQGKILCSGNSLAEVLENFDELLKNSG